MTTCAQNQSNQDDETAGGSANDNHLEALEHSGAASHFLGQVMKVSFIKRFLREIVNLSNDGSPYVILPRRVCLLCQFA